MAEAISADLAREWFSYDALTGAIHWKKPKGVAKGGDEAGSINRLGYWCLKFQGRQYLSHRLAWLISYGAWPSGDIDHMNGCRSDNRLINLRDVPRSTNAQNAKKARISNRSSGLLGVTRARSKWVASIWFDGRRHHLGAFFTADAAHQAYLTAKRQKHPGCLI